MNTRTDRFSQSKKAYFYLAIGVVCVLLLPALAMQFTDEVQWKLGDFLIMGLLLIGFGTFFIFVSSKISMRLKIALAGFTLLFFLLVWAELATGFLALL